MLSLGLVLAALLGQANVPAAPPSTESGGNAPREASFDYEMPGLPIPRWTIQVGADGKGHYQELGVQQAGASAAPLPLQVGGATQQRLQGGYGMVSAGTCETAHKHLANMGSKKLAYRSTGGDWISCTFNYSDQKALMDAASAFVGIAQTLQDGAQLEHSHRFDRLGLDAEIDELARQVHAGQAVEIQNIAPVLQGIVQDQRVMDRVRRKSGRLLQDAGLSLGSDRPPVASDAATDADPGADSKP